MTKTIPTRDFEDVEIDDEKIIVFPNGIPAFEDSREFVIISPLGDNVYPMWLQSVEDSSLCFIVYNPLEILPNYDVNLSGYERKLLEITDDTDYLALVIARLADDYRDTVVNMRSPIIVNLHQRIAAQIILPSDEYMFRYPVYSVKEGV
ncbi:MAG: flagellar assembly protein FliW [Oscillospiraceae bacterium]|jgi:flagellar assembly factor FliW|nr:flagellar assembly protein FliW [Oscillospiraceae bacterium]